jgi:hypothetical protein
MGKPAAETPQDHGAAEAAFFLVTVAAFALQPTLIVAASRTFQCTTEALGGSTYLLADFRIPCLGTQHAVARAFAAAVLVVSVGFPSFALLHVAHKLQRRGAAALQDGRRKPQPGLASQRSCGTLKRMPSCHRRLPASLEDSYAFVTSGFCDTGDAGEALGCGLMLLRRLCVALAIGLLSDTKLPLSVSAIVLLGWLVANTTVRTYRSPLLALVEAALLMGSLGLAALLVLL